MIPTRIKLKVKESLPETETASKRSGMVAPKEMKYYSESAIESFTVCVCVCVCMWV